jgi:hypothetical protein
VSAIERRRCAELKIDSLFFSRAFDLLGFDEFVESFSDGIQMLRYNQSTAYDEHLDYVIVGPGNEVEHDYDSSQTGGNRFATILLYMTGTCPRLVCAINRRL